MQNGQHRNRAAAGAPWQQGRGSKAAQRTEGGGRPASHQHKHRTMSQGSLPSRHACGRRCMQRIAAAKRDGRHGQRAGTDREHNQVGSFRWQAAPGVVGGATRGGGRAGVAQLSAAPPCLPLHQPQPASRQQPSAGQGPAAHAPPDALLPPLLVGGQQLRGHDAHSAAGMGGDDGVDLGQVGGVGGVAD